MKMVTESKIEEYCYLDRMDGRTRNNSVIRRRKARKNNELKMRRSMSCDEIVLYRNRAVSPVWCKELKNIRPKNGCQKNTQKKTNKLQNETKKRSRYPKNSSTSNKVDERRPLTEENMKTGVLTKKLDFPTNSLLHYAVSEGDLELVERLISDGSNQIDKLSIDGTAPIHEAAINGDLSCIKLLLKYGASLETADRCNRTAVEYAVLAGHFDCAALLLSLGASDEKIRNGVPLLH